MILAPLSDPVLRSAVLRAALPEEDVLLRPEEVREGLRFGFPRLLVHDTRDPFSEPEGPGETGRGRAEKDGLPCLLVTSSVLRSWTAAWRSRGLAVRRIDDSALRLRHLMARSAGRSPWADGVLRRLTYLTGRPLPRDFRGFARRAMEFPAGYAGTGSVAGLVSLTPGALKGRFRRRGLPSPSSCLRWCRLLAAGHILADPMETTLSAAYRLGFSSDGNFCRWVRSTCGLRPSELREQSASYRLLARFREECLGEGMVEAWNSLGGLFLREVA
jgi:AraC-like DNA-binding protein